MLWKMLRQKEVREQSEQLVKQPSVQRYQKISSISRPPEKYIHQSNSSDAEKLRKDVQEQSEQLVMQPSVQRY